ncbi:hypothetical protein GCM10011585_29160 [Edaphobacter dinghuensis]|uniref:Uncharacterized protein n=1 Tax=Edaphobacter dinghuensis TaxID=1560005 RepID=A0A917HMI7_9BACT|nr:hypothetical protein GCM10011585_29160 [Edaphobacter dinghuensis]
MRSKGYRFHRPPYVSCSQQGSSQNEKEKIHHPASHNAMSGKGQGRSFNCGQTEANKEREAQISSSRAKQAFSFQKNLATNRDRSQSGLKSEIQ